MCVCEYYKYGMAGPRSTSSSSPSSFRRCPKLVFCSLFIKFGNHRQAKGLASGAEEKDRNRKEIQVREGVNENCDDVRNRVICRMMMMTATLKQGVIVSARGEPKSASHGLRMKLLL